jgi:hypothetical protein
VCVCIYMCVCVWGGGVRTLRPTQNFQQASGTCSILLSSWYGFRVMNGRIPYYTLLYACTHNVGWDDGLKLQFSVSRLSHSNGFQLHEVKSLSYQTDLNSTASEYKHYLQRCQAILLLEIRALAINQLND